MAGGGRHVRQHAQLSSISRSSGVAARASAAAQSTGIPSATAATSRSRYWSNGAGSGAYFLVAPPMVLGDHLATRIDIRSDFRARDRAAALTARVVFR